MSEDKRESDYPQQEKKFLAGKLVVAMPHSEDTRFYQSVVFICGHDETGAMGIMINKPLSSVKFTDLLNQLGIGYPADVPSLPIYYGGPVEIGRGFVLHSSEYLGDTSTIINNKLALTATLDVLKAIAYNRGPKKKIVALGYVGWGAYQLEQEIQNNAWIVIDPTDELLFSENVADVWKTAMASIGVDPTIISLEYGHA